MFMPAQTEHPIVSFFHRWDQFTLFNHKLGYYLKKRSIGTNQTQTNNPKLSGQLYYWDHPKAQITKGIGKPQNLHNSTWTVFKLSQTLVYFKAAIIRGFYYSIKTAVESMLHLAECEQHPD